MPDLSHAVEIDYRALFALVFFLIIIFFNRCVFLRWPSAGESVRGFFFGRV